MGTLAKGDIVLFPFPYTDLSTRKLRPCLVISDEMKEDVILCQITSQRIVKDRYSIELKQRETIGGSLQVDSYIRANMIFTATRRQILKKVCSAPDSTYKKVTESILEIIEK